MSSGLRFTKLEALGNDFVLLDRRDGLADPAPERIRALADRHTGIGFDQLLILAPLTDDGADCQVRIYNRDGSPASQCGNGMRAIARWLEDEQPGRRQFVLATPAGRVEVDNRGSDGIRANMGHPRFGAEAVGLAPDLTLTGLVTETLGEHPGLQAIGLVSMGNPHLILLLDAPPPAALVAEPAAALSRHPAFAAGVNVSFAVVDPATGRVELSVHERGVGPTRACGSAACATAAFLIRTGRVTTPVEIRQPGGRLVIDWPGDDDPLWMTGPARRVFDGTLLI
ncbi:MAG: diaminopimelate epimerase [Wenzhouxiangella sp.]